MLCGGDGERVARWTVGGGDARRGRQGLGIKNVYQPRTQTPIGGQKKRARRTIATKMKKITKAADANKMPKFKSQKQKS